MAVAELMIVVMVPNLTKSEAKAQVMGLSEITVHELEQSMDFVPFTIAKLSTAMAIVELLSKLVQAKRQAK